MATRSVNVEVISASGLKDTELFGTSDPYVIASVGKETRKTKPADDQGETPTWNELLPSLPVSETDTELLVRVLNDDTLGRDEDMGRVVIPLSCIHGGSHTFPMELKGKPHGEITLNLSYEGEGHHEEHHGLSEKVHSMFVGDKKDPDHDEGEGVKEKLEDKVEGIKEKKHRKKRRGSGDEGSGSEGSSSSSSQSEKDD